MNLKVLLNYNCYCRISCQLAQKKLGCLKRQPKFFINICC